MSDAEVFDADDVQPVPTTQLVPVGPKFLIGGFSIHLQPRAAKPTFAEVSLAIDVVGRIQNRLPFFIGDLMNLGESLYAEQIHQVVSAERWSESTVKTYTWVSKQVAPEIRELAMAGDNGLEFGHLQAVAALGPIQQRKWVLQAREQGWSVAKLKTEMMAATEGGKSNLRYMLIVDCGSEAKQEKLAESLRGDGYVCSTRTSVKRKEKKTKKKGAVTAQKRRGRQKTNTKRRVPQGWDARKKKSVH